MEPRDYHLWKQIQKQARQDLFKAGDIEAANAISNEEELEDDVFEAVSKRAWTDILLQLFKVGEIIQKVNGKLVFICHKVHLNALLD